ncbi:MAG: NAD(P)/FAD-dependent oxidoreductase [Bacteroidota bacterium]
MTTTTTPILIIGAGPAGLGIAGQLRKAGLDFEVLEQSDKVGVSWHNHYDRLHLHTVKQLSHLPHLPFPEDYPLYVPRAQVATYFENYAEHFNIQPHFNQTVVSVKKENGNWVTTTKEEATFHSEKVIVATGVNRVPNIPSWPGQKDFVGTILHAREYKNAQPFRNKKVLVVGMGNTGAELALDLSENDCETYLSVRGPVSIVPRDLNGRPVQLTSIQLAKIPFGIGDWLGNFIRGIYLGNLSKYGLQTPKLSPAKQLKVTGKTPVVDIGTVNQIKAGKIKVMPAIERFESNGVLFKNGKKVEIDAVILATGYRAKVEDFLEDAAGLINQDNLPKSAICQGQHKGLYFIGFDNYKLGGILGIIRTESEEIANHILQY